MRAAARIALADLPRTIPIFPLTGVLLLPGGKLPLNIFEPRYLAMTADALGAPYRLIGMIQPSEEERPDAPQPLHAVGCAGRIVQFAETDDGRFTIALQGVCRFGVAREVEGVGGYRRVTPDFVPWRADLDLARDDEPALDRPRMTAALKAYFAQHKIKADWKAVEEMADSRLIATLSMLCPFEPAEKQSLLECRTVGDRARLLVALLEMAMMGRPGEPVKH